VAPFRIHVHHCCEISLRTKSEKSYSPAQRADPALLTIGEFNEPEKRGDVTSHLSSVLRSGIGEWIIGV
jgi:hypothetical protein